MARSSLWANLNARDAMIAKMEISRTACSLLAAAGTPPGSKAFAAWFRECTAHIDPLSSESDEDILRFFSDWCTAFSKKWPLPAPVAEALQARLAQKKKLRRMKSDYVNHFDLKFDEAKRDAFVASLPTQEVERLKTPYPAAGFFAYERDSIAAKWRKKLLEDKQPDDRLKRRSLRKVSEKELKLIIPEGEDAIFVDKKKNIIGGVIRNFCPDSEACSWVDSVVQDQVEFRKSVRLEDPGSIVQIGYSAGSRSSPKFDWVRNVQQEGAFPPGTREERNRQASCAFAYMWNLARNKVPKEVIKDFENFVEKLEIGRMDNRGSMARDGKGVAGESGTMAGANESTGSYTLQSGGNIFTFHDAELAPPTGVMASNYSRAVHSETQPNKFSISWTTSRSHPAKAGGHFYIASYGIRINADANTAIFWQPKHFHCTSLQDVDPYDSNPNFFQCGLALVTPARLESIWARYKKSLITPALAEKEILKDEEEEDNSAHAEQSGSDIEISDLDQEE